ncbi:hypothetical protein L484_008099 [Morus notabilis]|uniref:Uncharacterized protein n=1 Tax=Morus notabilis TaxID=981085 RepID=W9RDP2_9ROSA|nr:hypothetical protein L484_008099 [Morus notabilis]
MALLPNIFGCFSESPQSSESKQYICDRDVCVLKTREENSKQKQKQKQGFGVSFALLSMRKS